MSESLLPMVEEEWKKPPVSPPAVSLITQLGLIEGEVLEYLEARGQASLRHLVRALQQPSVLVMMAVGALIRSGLVRGMQHELEVILERDVPRSVGARMKNRLTPEVWGG